MPKKPTFRTYLGEAVQERFGTTLAKLKPHELSREMTRLYVDRVLRPLEPTLLPEDPEDFESCFVDAPYDVGVDYLFRSDSGVVVIQAKHRTRNKPESPEEFGYFRGVLRRLHPTSGKDYSKHFRLQEVLADIDWTSDSFNLIYVTLGRATDTHRNDEYQGVETFPEVPDLDDRATIQFLDEWDLNAALRDALAVEEGIPRSVSLRFERDGEQPPWLAYDAKEGHVSYVGRMAAVQLRELYKQYRTRLFSLNIRNYVGDTSTNKNMIRVAQGDPDRFFFYNNGISAVATTITPRESEAILQCERLSVVNGAQTVRSLSKAVVKSNSAPAVCKAQVLVRVTTVSLSPRMGEADFLDNITHYNNTQNQIKPSDFRSNDPIQRELQRRFDKLSCGGRGIRYKNKRSDRESGNPITIGLEEFTKTVHAFDHGPADMFGGTNYLFDTDPDKGYVKVFGEDGQLVEHLSKAHFERLAGIWFFCSAVRTAYREVREQRATAEEAFIREQLERGLPDPGPAVRPATERRWVIYYTVGRTLRERYNDVEALTTHLCKWSDPNVAVRRELSGVPEAYARDACERLTRIYRNARNRAGFTHRNWFRSTSTLATINTDIFDNAATVAQLPALRPS